MIFHITQSKTRYTLLMIMGFGIVWLGDLLMGSNDIRDNGLLLLLGMTFGFALTELWSQHRLRTKEP
ncbi:hypothetical protein E3U23_10360 [Erythrobacter litoralis]|uniref:hypothetical protein n=1 Tax=Erythrobacter litoralis TaxID=39960 RepID=UPI0024355EF8|nr:hypothetical protein [Erythrobacter litoralis]MDG6079597.1 hypothetical protein [Erythrobacter litoralis]